MFSPDSFSRGGKLVPPGEGKGVGTSKSAATIANLLSNEQVSEIPFRQNPA
jgi:hypothetical protein